MVMVYAYTKNIFSSLSEIQIFSWYLVFYLQDVTTPVKLGWGEGNQKSRQLG